MRFNRLPAIAGLCLLLAALNSSAARPTKQEMEQNFLYGWSSASTLIFFGTVAAVEYDDDPTMRAATAEVMVRVDSLQRGVPGNSMVQVRIEDELQAFAWRGDVSRIGETGIWFLHRVRQYEGAPPRGYLVRYMDVIEMQEDPQYLAELMKYVVQDTVDQTIRPNILNLLTGQRGEREHAKMVMDLHYDENGALSDLQVVERSNNLLFNDHVFDTVLQIHRRIRVPGQVKSTRIAIQREAI